MKEKKNLLSKKKLSDYFFSLKIDNNIKYRSSSISS